MSDTKILDAVLKMVVANEECDWVENDAVTEFRQIANHIRDRRASIAMSVDGRRYATCAWAPGDIKELRPDWSLEKCDEWLQNNKRQIQNDTTERGWDSIRTLLEMTEEVNE